MYVILQKRKNLIHYNDKNNFFKSLMFSEIHSQLKNIDLYVIQNIYQNTRLHNLVPNF